MNQWLKYGWVDDEEDIEQVQTADTLKPEDLEKLLKNKSENKSGINCKICKDYFDFAESNQEDGTFLCRECKFNPYRSSFTNSD